MTAHEMVEQNISEVESLLRVVIGDTGWLTAAGFHKMLVAATGRRKPKRPRSRRPHRWSSMAPQSLSTMLIKNAEIFKERYGLEISRDRRTGNNVYRVCGQE